MRNTQRVFESRGYNLGIPMTNLVTNGDFSSGTTGWTPTRGTITVSSAILSLTGDGSLSNVVVTNASTKTIIDHKYYYKFRYRVTNSSCQTVRVNVGLLSVINTPTINTWYTPSAIITSTSVGSFGVYHFYADSATANGKVMEIDGNYGIKLIDLTATFGAGNEPTAAEMDAMTATWFNGTAYQPLTGYLKSLDRSRYANNAILSGGAAWKKVGDQYVLDFTNPTAKATIAKNASINDMPQFTFRCWFYYAGAGGFNIGRLVDKAIDTLANGWTLSVAVASGSGRIRLTYGFTGNIGKWYSPSSGLVVGRSYCIECSYSRTLTTNVPTIFINGVNQTVFTDILPIGTARSDATYDMVIGNQPASDLYINGYLSDIQILNRLSTAAEAKRYFNSTCRRYGLQPIA